MLSKAFLVSLLGLLATAHPTSIDIVFTAPAVGSLSSTSLTCLPLLSILLIIPYLNKSQATDVCPSASGFYIPTTGLNRLYRLSCGTDVNTAQDIKTLSSVSDAQKCAQYVFYQLSMYSLFLADLYGTLRACEDYDKSGTCTAAVYASLPSKCYLKSGTLKISANADSDALIRTNIYI